MKKLSKIIKDDRGSSLIELLIYLGIFLALIGWGTDYYHAINIKRGVTDSIKFAALAASQQTDQAKLNQGALAIDPTQADVVFLEMLKKNLSLDNNLNPLPGSPVIYVNKATLYYKTFNSDALPAVSPIDGHAITEPSYVVYIEVRVRRGLTQIVNSTSYWTIKVAKDAALKISP
jgi:Flp pilus assembly protein TadG